MEATHMYVCIYIYRVNKGTWGLAVQKTCLSNVLIYGHVTITRASGTCILKCDTTDRILFIFFVKFWIFLISWTSWQPSSLYIEKCLISLTWISCQPRIHKAACPKYLRWILGALSNLFSCVHVCTCIYLYAIAVSRNAYLYAF